MTREIIISLILSTALEAGVPPNFALAVAIEESNLNPTAVNINSNGTIDRGIMQLNSASFPNVNWQCVETNIRTGILYIKELSERIGINTWWAVIIAYNAGYGRLNDPPDMTIDYANRVIARFNELCNGNAPIMVRSR